MPVMATILLMLIGPGSIIEAPDLTLRLDGPVGDHVTAVVENWVLPAPEANPGMINMFRLRDRQPPYEDPVPWAGEFAGKYLIGAVQLRRMTDDPRLDDRLRGFVAALIETQGDDGYFGPFPKDRRWNDNWDLWGHYHVLLGLYMWYEDTGDQAALDAATRTADFICETFLDGERRVHDTGWQEMNMAIMHVLGLLYRETGRAPYLELMRQIEADWEKAPAGDYLRTGLDGVPFYQTPKPRWESLHCLQGLTELYRITGEEKYKSALVHHWKSIAATDIHNAGTFSTGEGAIGNPFAPGAIETCCTVAWMALSVDVLRLTGDGEVADYLERALLNGMLGAIHPSGRWATYDTPMDGKRVASAQSIVFQSRPGTPELNCCSANAPRGIGVLSEWAVLGDGETIYLNWYGPGVIDAEFGEARWQFEQTTHYPVDGEIAIVVTPPAATRARIALRGPQWSEEAVVRVNDAMVTGERSSGYLFINRDWRAGDRIVMNLDMSLRPLRGDGHVNFGTSLFHGPLLLAYDQQYNTLDPAELPPINIDDVHLQAESSESTIATFAVSANDSSLALVDYASAGASGTAYRTWLDVEDAPPVPVTKLAPESGARLSAADILFQWSGGPPGSTEQVVIGRDAALADRVAELPVAGQGEAHFEGALESGQTYFWQVEQLVDGHWRATGGAPWEFQVAANHAERTSPIIDHVAIGSISKVARTQGVAGESTAYAFDGSQPRIVVPVEHFPLRTYTFSAWINPSAADGGDSGWQQVFSAWCRASDDPLRVSVQRGKLVVQVEQPGRTYRLERPSLENGKWRHVAVVKNGPLLRLYLDGTRIGELNVPPALDTKSEAVGIGSNPMFQDPESFSGAIDALRFEGKAVTEETIRGWHRAGAKAF